MKNLFVLVSFALLLHLCSGTLVNVEVSRSIDLKTHLAKISSFVTLRNDGPSAAKEFEVVVDPSNADKLAYIAVSLAEDTEDEGTSDLKITESQKTKNLFVVKLPKALAAGQTNKLKVEEIYTRALKPFPEEITQSQKQLVKYEGNHFYYSPYLTETQSTDVELFSAVTEDYSKLGTTKLEESTLKYGGSDEYKNVKPFSQDKMSLHFENNSPFLTATKVTRVIEISHWGNIAVEETIDILQTGAKFKGSFSRYDYQRSPNSGVSSIKSFKTILPASAADTYYRDEIGNISTSNLLNLDDSVELEIRPRFPLFGGWKTHYYIGYNLPSYTYLYRTGDLHALRMRFVDHIYDDMVIDDLTVKVILPEGCKHISVDVPYDVDREQDILHYTYLDTVGRPVITFNKKNVVEQHIKDFTLSYNFSRLMLLQEPLLVVGAFFLLFFTVIILVRLDFSITYDKVSEAKMRVQSVIEQVQKHQRKRSDCYRLYENAISSYKTKKDNTEFSSSRKAIDKTHRECTATIKSLLPKLQDDTVVHDKVVQLNKMDENVMDKYNHAVQLAEKLVMKRLAKDMYVGHNQKNQKAIEEFQEKINEITDNLC